MAKALIGLRAARAHASVYMADLAHDVLTADVEGRATLTEVPDPRPETPAMPLE
jgi:hypothetical protein